MVFLKLKMLRECLTLLRERNARSVSLACVCRGEDNPKLSPLLSLKTQMEKVQHRPIQNLQFPL